MKTDFSNTELGYVARGYSAWKDYNDNKLTIKPTDAMQFGSAFHCICLEENTFQDRYFVEEYESPSGLMRAFCQELAARKVVDLEHVLMMHKEAFEACRLAAGFKIGREQVLKKLSEPENVAMLDNFIRGAGRIVIKKSDYESLLTMRSNLYATKFVEHMEKARFIEHKLFMESKLFNEKNGTQLSLNPKGYIDLATTDNIIIDLKTTNSYGSDFKGNAEKYGYDRQAALYLDLFGADATFLFYVVETNYPYSVMSYRVTAQTRQLGRIKYCDLERQLTEFIAFSEYDAKETENTI